MLADDTCARLMQHPAELKGAWDQEGVVVVRGLFSATLVAQLHPVLERVLAQWLACDPQTGSPGVEGSRVMRHLNHAAYHRAHRDDQTLILESMAHPGVLALMRLLYGEEPMFRSTSLFFSSHEGNHQGGWHRDTQFAAADDDEDRRRFLEAQALRYPGIQLQVPMLPSEDIEIVPGSHLRYDTEAEFVLRRSEGGRRASEDGMPGALRPRLAAGDAILFNPCALHRGRSFPAHPRRTYMLTYTPTSCPNADWFSDQPWCLETDYLDGCTPEARRVVQDFVTTYRDHWMASHRG
jgi:hypothetical protein